MIAEILSYYGQPIADLRADPEITDIMINGHERIFVERGGRIERSAARFPTAERLDEFVRQIAHNLGQTIDARTHPILDARLPDGSRINAVLQPVAIGGTVVTIRPAPHRHLSADELVARRMLTPAMLARIREGVEAAESLLTAGGTGSGKTTLLRAFSAFIPAEERIVTIEDTHEDLVPGERHVVRLEAALRRRQLDRDQITVGMDRLIVNALRMRPDRIIVGEIRTPEAAEAYVRAMNTGHGGSMSTIHANSAGETYLRLRDLLTSAAPAVPPALHEETVRANVRLVIHVARLRIGSDVRRRVTAMSEFVRGPDGLHTRTLWRYVPEADSWEDSRCAA